ncbi:8820_t:CDS:1, partial [Ambispora leptoticha]
LKAYYDIGCEHPTFLQCRGVSKDESTNNYGLVMHFASMGSLRQNLLHVSQMKWSEKLSLLSNIAFDLQLIHSHNIIHRDLHSGNILQNKLYSAYIGDLGIAISIDEESETKFKGVYGNLPYISPEVLQGKSYEKLSDIYSFGII